MYYVQNDSLSLPAEGRTCVKESKQRNENCENFLVTWNQETIFGQCNMLHFALETRKGLQVVE